MKIIAYADTIEQAQAIIIKMLIERAGRFDGAGRNKTEQKENKAIARELRVEAEWLRTVEFQPITDQGVDVTKVLGPTPKTRSVDQEIKGVQRWIEARRQAGHNVTADDTWAHIKINWPMMPSPLQEKVFQGVVL